MAVSRLLLPGAGWRRLAASAGIACLVGAAPAAAAPNVVVSIKPLHALVAGVMGDLGQPRLLIQGAGSPHSYAMKPSDARSLDEADLVFRASETLETFLDQPLRALADRARVIDLAEAPGVETLAFRSGEDWGGAHGPHSEEGHDTDHAHEEPGHHDDHDDGHDDDHAHDKDHEHDDDHGHDKAAEHDAHEGHDHSGIDPHVWLDPANARAMTDAIAAALAEADPANAEAYEANAARQNGRLAELQDEIAQTIAPVRGTPFIVFHDGYHYFEHRFDIEAAGAVAVNPERQPGAAHVREIRDLIRAKNAACVFAEPQFRPALVETLVEGTQARVGTLDPLGADLAEGADAYPALIRNLARALVDCLRQAG